MTLQVTGTNVVNQNRSFVLGTATPGSPVTGMIRYNNSSAQFEVYNGTQWTAIISQLPSTPPAFGWGLDTSGQLGVGGGASTRLSPVSVVGGFTNWTQISAGLGTHTVGLRSGQAWAWGGNLFGQLADGTSTSRSSPVSVVGGFTDWVQIAASNHTVGIRANGQAWAWGANSYGRIGDGTTTSRSSPVSIVGGITNWTQVSCGAQHTAAIRANGQAWCWGRNQNGQLGNSTITGTSSPVSVAGGITDWVQISAGNHTVGVRANGQAFAWGLNGDGQLGRLNTTNYSSPVFVANTFDWLQIAAGRYHTVGIRANGQAWSFGRNVNGQLGDNTTVNKSSPILVVGGFTDWVQVAAGSRHTVGIRTNGQAWCWGYNNNGQLGDGFFGTSSLSPVSVLSGFTDWVQIAGGNYFTMALRAI